MSATVRAATLVALAVAALALLLAEPTAGEAEPEAWIDDWFPQPIDTDSDGAADSFNNTIMLATNREELNVTVAMVIYRNGTPVANLSSNHTLHRNATTGWGWPWPAGYWVALEWSTNENGSYNFSTALYNETGVRLDNRDSYSYLPLIAPGEGVLAFELEVTEPVVYISVEPGNEASGWTNLTLTNTGNALLLFDIQISGSVFFTSPESFTTMLSPGESHTQAINVTAPTRTVARNVNVTFTVDGRDIFSGEVRTSQTMNITAVIKPYVRLSLRTEMWDGYICFGCELPFQFTVKNDGNTDVMVYVSVINYDELISDGFKVDWSEEPFLIERAREVPFFIKITVPKKYTLESDFYFTVTVTANASVGDSNDTRTLGATFWARNCTLETVILIALVFTPLAIILSICFIPQVRGNFIPPVRSAMRRLRGRLRRTAAAARGRWRTRRRREARGPRSAKPPPP